jgi:hypothetical protein
MLLEIRTCFSGQMIGHFRTSFDIGSFKGYILIIYPVESGLGIEAGRTHVNFWNEKE